MWGARILLAVLIAFCAGCSTASDGTPTAPPPTTPARTVTAPAKPVEIRQVVDTAPEVRLKDRDGEEYTLGPVEMKMDRFDQAYVMPAVDGPGQVIYLELPADLADGFAKLTTGNVGKRLAMIAGGTVIFAPEISGAIVDGRIQISGNYTKPEADAILTSITGR